MGGEEDAHGATEPVKLGPTQKGWVRGKSFRFAFRFPESIPYAIVTFRAAKRAGLGAGLVGVGVGPVRCLRHAGRREGMQACTGIWD